MRQLVPTKLGHPKTGVQPRVHHQSGLSERPLRPIVRPNHAERACARRNCSQCRTLGCGVSAFLALSGQVDGVFAARSLAVSFLACRISIRRTLAASRPLQPRLTAFPLQDFRSRCYKRVCRARLFRFYLRQFRAPRLACACALPSLFLSAFACLAF